MGASLRCAAAGRAAGAARLLAKSSLMPVVAAGGTAATEERGSTMAAVAVAGKGYNLSPYGEEALRRAEDTCSCERTVASSRGECGAGEEKYKLSKMARAMALLSVQLSIVSHRCL